MDHKYQKSLSSSLTTSRYITNFNTHGRISGLLPKKDGCDRNLFSKVSKTLLGHYPEHLKKYGQ